MTIYLVYENSDKCEGRGSMQMVPNSGYFTNENEAWVFADTVCGIMGRRPQSGSWRNEKYPDVHLKKIEKHDATNLTELREIEAEIRRAEYRISELRMRKHNLRN